MKTPLIRSLATYLIAAIYGALIGVSLTHTKAFPSDQGLAFSMAGLGIALVGVFFARTVSGRIIVALPPIEPRQLLGLKILIAGFVVAVNGWLVASLVFFDAGVRIAALGIAIGFVGMGVHLVLSVIRNHG